MHACMDVCMYVCVCMHACMHACARLPTYLPIYVRMYLCIYMYLCITVFMYLCIYVLMYWCIYVCMYVCACINVCTRALLSFSEDVDACLFWAYINMWYTYISGMKLACTQKIVPALHWISIHMYVIRVHQWNQVSPHTKKEYRLYFGVLFLSWRMNLWPDLVRE